MDTLILISLHWKFKFHVHKNAFNLVVEAILTHNLIGKCEQLIAYAMQLVNNIGRNYMMT